MEHNRATTWSEDEPCSTDSFGMKITGSLSIEEKTE
jgi:hypothetical protein